MPLKHKTETLFVAILTIVILATGVLLASLPPLPNGSIPWAILFIATLLYPSVLMPFFRTERADHEFRSLHWFPMTMTLLWLGFALLAWFVPITSIALKAYTWAWLLPMITFAIIGLLLFCSKVIRQLAKRTFVVLALFIPFAAVALWSSSGPRFERTITSMLWERGGEVANTMAGTLPVIGDELKNTVNDTVELIALDDAAESSNSSSEQVDEQTIEASSVSSLGESEQEWKLFLEGYAVSSISSSSTEVVAMDSSSSDSDDIEISSSAVSSVAEERDGLLGFLQFGNSDGTTPTFADDPAPTDTIVVEDATVNTQEAPVKTKDAPLLIGQNSSVPSHLPNSGFGWSLIIVSMIALYSAVLHKRQVQLS